MKKKNIKESSDNNLVNGGKNNKNFTTSEVIVLILTTFIVGLVFGKIIVSKKNAYTFTKTNDQYINKFIKNYKYIVDNYYKELDKDQLINNAISGMMQSLDDPYSVYISEEESNNFNITLDGSYKGFGIQIQKNEENGYMVITSIFKNSPAEISGLKVGDQIISIDNVESKDLSVSDFSSNIRNSSNKTFNLKVLRDGDEIDVTVNKELVVLDSVASKMLEIDKKNVGYIYISIFANNTYSQFKKQLEELESKNIEYLIIDVRSNTGGHLTSVTSILDLFINSNQIMYQFEQNNKIKPIYGNGKKNKKYEIVLLANEMSASASEVLIAGLKENFGCKLIGKKTYGKGTVQEMVNLSDGNQYKITVKKWLTPKGNWVNDTEGIMPDIEIDLEKEYYELGDESADNQLNAAIDYIRKKYKAMETVR